MPTLDLWKKFKLLNGSFFSQDSSPTFRIFIGIVLELILLQNNANQQMSISRIWIICRTTLDLWKKNFSPKITSSYICKNWRIYRNCLRTFELICCRIMQINDIENINNMSNDFWSLEEEEFKRIIFPSDSSSITSSYICKNWRIYRNCVRTVRTGTFYCGIMQINECRYREYK